MRYEKPELVLLGEAASVVLGGPISLDPETVESSRNPGLIGYDA